MLPTYHLHKLFKELYGDGPWMCGFCGKKVKVFQLCVHHKNEDRNDHNRDNLEACHKGCHSAHHNKHRTHSEEQRRRQAEVARRVFIGRRKTEDHKRKIGDANRGKIHTTDARANMSAAHKGKPWSPARRAAFERTLDQTRPSDDQ